MNDWRNRWRLLHSAVAATLNSTLPSVSLCASYDERAFVGYIGHDGQVEGQTLDAVK